VAGCARKLHAAVQRARFPRGRDAVKGREEEAEVGEEKLEAYSATAEEKHMVFVAEGKHIFSYVRSDR
jgi:hypothetical protein